MSATTSTMSSAGSSKSILINNLEARGLGFHAASVDGTEQFRPRDPRAGFPGPFVVAEGRSARTPRRGAHRPPQNNLGGSPALLRPLVIS
ncbi:MAG: hypothetical protein RAK18_08355, partial [Conexivisphaerales archaeon]|nr:hypothetical protein [Conexivisphaerales archaeon]